ncbi:glyoxalase/bleomycin resistance/extradiol dioxygenase family protein [Bifidobacterium aemilianum]|uniref:Glyoxalase/bleomycin resistance/extradiol dioxygenase family protein n=2 Tax=Bifidobacterium aemilianum TaxID=2493120 RepID=A0A366K8K0_9BIFI|nr:VOC family protein [Bifidobacterium aemilianum]RBP97572.1 glyoxalase/bleomycin resistance/extradiol dioxygenase family protein [Bifidobacterium aemilianum]
MTVMTAFTTDLQHSGMPAKDLDETIRFYTEVMGFELAGLFHNGDNRCAFLRYGHLTVETWEGDPANMRDGAINHWAFDTPDIDAAFENAKRLGLDFKDTEIQAIPTFWDKGIRYFNIYGPNHETIEFCQIVK